MLINEHDLAKTFNEGWQGFWDNNGNPYEINSIKWDIWEMGWDYAQFKTNQIGEDAIYEKL